MSADSKEAKGPRTWLFGVLSALYLAIVLGGAAGLGYLDPNGTPIEPNEWGDVLAGVFSPLAFLWLIYASLSQRAELAMQRAELTANNVTQDAQREEMRRQVEAMTAQANLLEAQAVAMFDPIFAIQNVTTHRGRWQIRIVNHGSVVVDAYFSSGFDVLYKDGGNTGFDSDSSRVFVWLPDSQVTVSPTETSEDHTYEMAVQVTRRDGQIRTYRYLVNPTKSALLLLNAESRPLQEGCDFPK